MKNSKVLQLTLLVCLIMSVFMACTKTDTNITHSNSTEAESDIETLVEDPIDKVYYSITTSAEDNHGLAGTYTKLTNKKVAVGETMTLSATVNEGYNFEGWYLQIGTGWFSEKIFLTDDLDYTFILTEKDDPNVTYVAVFNYYTVSTYSHSDDYGVAGTYTKIDNQKYSIGETVTLEATVNEGYNFEGWFEDGVCVGNDLTYTFIMEKEDESLEARYSYYSISTYGWDDEYGVAGSFTEFEDKKISAGETVTLEATVNEGYNFEGWYEGDICIENDLTYTFVMGKSNRDLTARYSWYDVNTYSGSDDYGLAGTYTKLEGKKISAGETVTLEATVNDGYNFEGWFKGDVCVCKDLIYTFEMTKQHEHIDVRYSYYTVSTGSDSDDFGAAGSYTKLEGKKISIGETVTVTATVKPGYEFIGWHIINFLVCTDTTYTFVMENESIDLYAQYRKIE